MKKLIVLCLASLFIFSCTDQLAQLPDYWEYSPGKWIAFKKSIELEWKSEEPKIDRFRIRRKKIKLNNDDLRLIIKSIKKKNIEGIVAIENALRNKTNVVERIEYFNSSDVLKFIDNKKPIPTHGEICFYQISTIKRNASSIPSELSVILLDRS